MNDIPKKQQHDDAWDACPRGEVSQLVQGLHAQRKQQSIVRAATIAACLLLIGVVGLFALPNSEPRQPNYGGIVCSKVVQHARAFIDGSLDAEIADRIRVHLGECKGCRDKINGMREPTALTHVESPYVNGPRVALVTK